MDWLDIVAVQRTLKSLLQYHCLKASILWCSVFLIQLSQPHTTTGKIIALTTRIFVSKVIFLLFNSFSFLKSFFMCDMPLRKVRIVKAMVFPVVMYRCESWTIKKAEHQRTDVFQLWCRRRLLRVLWIARRSNQLVLKEINPEYSLEGLMLKLKPPNFGHLM